MGMAGGAVEFPGGVWGVGQQAQWGPSKGDCHEVPGFDSLWGKWGGTPPPSRRRADGLGALPDPVGWVDPGGEPRELWRTRCQSAAQPVIWLRRGCFGGLDQPGAPPESGPPVWSAGGAGQLCHMAHCGPCRAPRRSAQMREGWSLPPAPHPPSKKPSKKPFPFWDQLTSP